MWNKLGESSSGGGGGSGNGSVTALSASGSESEWTSITFRNLLPRSDVCIVTLPLETGSPSTQAAGAPSSGGGGKNNHHRILHFCIGGQTKDATEPDTVESIEWQCRRSWRMASLNRGRIGCGAALLRGIIYTVGGLGSDSTVLSSVEKYSFFKEEKKWELLEKTSDMKMARWGHAVVPLPRKNAIFAIGGRNGSWEELSSVEVAQQNQAGDLQWNRLPYGMRQKRFGAAAVPIGDAAFMAIGGFDGKHWTKTAVMYEIDGDDIRDGVWKELCDMPKTVVFAKAAVTTINNSQIVFVAGATDDGKSILQAYSVKEDMWAIIETNGGEEGCSLAVEGDSLLCIGGDSNDVRCLNLKEESHRGTLGVLCYNLVPEVPAALIDSYHAVMGAAVDVHVQTNSTDSLAPPTRPPRASQPAPAPAPPAPAPAPEPTRRVENLEVTVEGETARYTGEVNAAGQRHGKGVLMWADQNGNFYPKGLSKNTYYEGEFHEDSRAGEGVFYVHEEGRLYQGTFQRGVLFGHGTLTDINRELEYTGNFRKGMSAGEGRCKYNATGRVFEGTWKRGRPITGRLIEADGRVSQSGNGPWSPELAVDLSRAGPTQNNGAGPLGVGRPGPFQGGASRPTHAYPSRGNTTAVFGNGATVMPQNDVPPPPYQNVSPLTYSTHSSGSRNNASQQENGVSAQESGVPTHVEKRDCIVEGEAAQYTGPLNAAGQRHGHGFMMWADEQGQFYPTTTKQNTYYEGEFFEDSRSGSGLMFVKDELRTYRGTFDRGVLTGEGSLEDGRRGMVYEGFFKKGTPHGEGKCVYVTSNRVFIGRWRKGQPIAGKLYNNQGQLLQQGNNGWGVELAVD